MKWLMAMVLGSTSVAACGGLNETEVRARGAAVLIPFKKELKQTLVDALAKGPEAAIEACAVEAPKIALRASTGGVTVGRASLRLRNPGNLAPSWVGPHLEGLSGPRVVALGAGRVGYLEPIKVDAMCTTCHGKAIAAPIAGKLAERYPFDQATGYAEGDLRGAFWVELSATP